MTRSEKLAQLCAWCGKPYGDHMKVSIGRICDGVLFRAADPSTPAVQEAGAAPASAADRAHMCEGRWIRPGQMQGRTLPCELRDGHQGNCGPLVSPQGEE